jgi:hypothetical protein
LTSAFIIAAATQKAYATAANVPRYPWDHRPNYCFANPAEGENMGCERDGEDWPSVETGTQRLQAVFDTGDPAVIALAQTDVAFSRERMGDGEYRATIWGRALSRSLQWSPKRHELAEQWHAAMGDEGMGCHVLAMAAFGDALAARGPGFSNTVSDAAWDRMREKMAEAHALLDACPDRVKETLPWHASKLQFTYLSTEKSGERSAQFDKAIQAWPDASSIYSVAMNFALPVWGGSFEQMEKVAQLALAKTKQATGSAVYSQLYAEALAQSGTHSFADAHADWDLMKASFRDREAYGAAAYWVLRLHPLLACARKDQAEAKRLFDVLRGFQDAAYDMTLNDTNDPCIRFAYQL